MNFEPKYIAIGITIISVLGFLVILGSLFLFSRFFLKRKEAGLKEITLKSLAYTVIWLLGLAASIWIFGSLSVWIFGLGSFGLLALLFYLAAVRLFSVSAISRIILGVFLAVVLNPVWFVLLGGLI